VTTERDVDYASATGADGRSAVEIVTILWEKVETLVQLEMRLGLAEAGEKVEALKRELAAMALGGAVAFAGLLALVAAVVGLLAMVMSVWLAALFTGAVMSTAGIVLLRRKVPSLPPAAARPTTKAVPQELLQTRTSEEPRHGTL
jgi:hypothetical protein